MNFNKKVILISGYSRGGTNILWNIMQSHPEICSACFETHTIFENNKLFLSRGLSLLRKFGQNETNLNKRLIDYGLYRIKMTNYNNIANRYISPEKTYTKKQISRSAICLKSVDSGIKYTDLLFNIYPELYFIALVRNGYALAEGHLRRGSSIEQISKLYQNIADKMKYFSENLKHFKLVKFEDMLTDPFSIASELFLFSDSTPFVLEHLRLKSKKIISDDGTHKVKFGEEKDKYWFNKETIGNFLDPAINEKQIKNLSNKDIKTFNKYAESALTFFGYEILN